MPKRKADSWPASILADPDVLSLDDEGRFVLCKVCHVHYAVHGGKKPKPVIMNSSFRTRAWDVHKERTNSHRMQKKQDAAHRLHQSARAAVAAATAAVAAASTPLADPDDEQKPPARDAPSSAKADAPQTQQQPPPPPASPALPSAHAMRTETESPPRFVPAAPSPPLPPTSRPPSQQQQQQHLSNSPLGRPEFMNPPPSPRRRVFRPTTTQQLSAHHQWQASLHDVHRRSPFSASSSHDHRLNAQPPSTSIVEAASNAAPPPPAGLSSASSPMSGPAPHGAPVPASAPPTSMHLRKQATSNNNSLVSSEQRDGMMRWRNMHDDVSRALGSSGKRATSSSYADAELRSALGETEDFGVNHEKVAKKLKSLDDEYDAKTLKRPDVHFDRRSASYKQYWGTMRNMYSASAHHSSANNHTTASSNPHRHSSTTNAHNAGGSTNHQHKSLPSLRREQQQQLSSNGTALSSMHRSTSREPSHDMTTPDDTGSSEDSTKTVVVHDQALVNAIDRLTGIVSKQLSAERHAHEASSATAHALASLASAVSEMRAHQDSAFGRLIELQEQRLQVMEAMLQHKLRKEARSTATAAANSTNSGAS